MGGRFPLFYSRHDSHREERCLRCTLDVQYRSCCKETVQAGNTDAARYREELEEGGSAMSSLQRPAPPAQTVTLSLEQVKEALGEVLDALQSSTGSARLEEARENSGNDLGKVLQLLLPAAVQIQQEVLQNYGFSPDGEGVLRFARLVKSFESQDPEIAAMSNKLKSFFLPPLPLPPHAGLPMPSS